MGPGKLTVIKGCMFSGKSTYLINAIRTTKYTKILVIKHAFDTRSNTDHIQSHNGDKESAIPVETIEKLNELITADIECVFIDEMQFYPNGLKQLIADKRLNGTSFVLAGLDKMYNSQNFGCTSYLSKIADVSIHLRGCCTMKPGCSEPSE